MRLTKKAQRAGYWICAGLCLVTLSVGSGCRGKSDPAEGTYQLRNEQVTRALEKMKESQGQNGQLKTLSALFAKTRIEQDLLPGGDFRYRIKLPNPREPGQFITREQKGTWRRENEKIYIEQPDKKNGPRKLECRLEKESGTEKIRALVCKSQGVDVIFDRQ